MGPKARPRPLLVGQSGEKVAESGAKAAKSFKIGKMREFLAYIKGIYTVQPGFLLLGLRE